MMGSGECPKDRKTTALSARARMLKEMHFGRASNGAALLGSKCIVQRLKERPDRSDRWYSLAESTLRGDSNYTENMQHLQRMTAIIEREDDGFVALCPELDIASQGASIEEARRNLVEALTLFFEVADESEIARRLRSEVFITQVEVPVG